MDGIFVFVTNLKGVLENGIACIPAITQQACACVIFLIFARKFHSYMHIFFAPHQVYQFYTELINSNAIRLTRKSRTRRPNEFHLGALGPTKKNMRHYHCRYLLCTSIKFNAITILFCTIFYNEVFSLGEVVPLYLSVIQFNLCFLQQMFVVTFVLNWLHYKHLCWFFWLVFFSPTENYAH